LLLNTLRQLNVDASRLKQDFTPPSRSIGSKNGISKKTKLELIQEIGKTSGPIEHNQTSESPVINNDNLPLTMDDWQNAMQKSNDQQIKDLIKLAKHKPKTGPKKENVTNSSSTMQTRIQNLASSMLAQNTNKAKITPTGTNDLSEDDTDRSQQINIDFQIKTMHEHLKKQPNLMDMYENANAKAASTTFSNKLDNRAALKLTTKPDQ
jgi:hypothetical protein